MFNRTTTTNSIPLFSNVYFYLCNHDCFIRYSLFRSQIPQAQKHLPVTNNTPHQHHQLTRTLSLTPSKILNGHVNTKPYLIITNLPHTALLTPQVPQKPPYEPDLTLSPCIYTFPRYYFSCFLRFGSVPPKGKAGGTVHRSCL